MSNAMEKNLRDLLARLARGEVDVDGALHALRDLPYSDLGFALVDHHRGMRCGHPEVVYCANKTVEQVTAIFGEIVDKGGNLLATRVSPELWEAVRPSFPRAEYNDQARTVTQRAAPEAPRGLVTVLAAGTSDIPVAEEARVTAGMMDARVNVRYDVGVAGIHRLFDCLDQVRESTCVVAVAGMEGALPSVVGGLVDRPVIAVPTSVGYGAHFQGMAPLLTMLNSCATGVAVVNIDNGFGAGYLAGLINRQAAAPPAQGGNL
jgi:NCAIR mutase (PurE)-related protein